MLNVGEFPWSWDRTKLSKEKEKFVVACFVLHSKWHTDISRRGRAVTIKKFTRKCAACVLRVKPIAFLTFSLSSRSWLLKLPEF